MVRSRRVAFSVVLGALLGAAIAGPSSALGATPTPPTLVLAATSGPPGLVVALSGDGYTPGTTYGLCLQPSSATGNCGYAGSDLGSFTAGTSGQVPGGAQARVPNVLAGTYQLLATAPGTAATVAAAAFSVTAPSMSLGTNAGPGGLAVTVTGSGYAPSTAYTLCIVPTGTAQCGGVGIPLGDVTADGSGALPSGTTVRIPGQLPATYDVGVMLKGASVPNLLVTSPFVEVAPTMAVNPAGGPGGTVATVTGAGLAPGGKYVICIVPAAATQCGGAGTNLATFTADGGGAIPEGTTVTIPPGAPGDYPVGILLADDTPVLIGSATFSRTPGSPPPTSPPGEATPTPIPTAAAGGPASPSPSAAPATSDQGPGGSTLLVIVALAIVAVIVVGLVLSRRRQSDARR